MQKFDNSIRENIRQLDAVPAQEFEPGKVWQALENRLQPQQKRRRIFFLRIAALLFALLVTTLLVFRKNNTDVSNGVRVQNATTPPPEKNTLPLPVTASDPGDRTVAETITDDISYTPVNNTSPVNTGSTSEAPVVHPPVIMETTVASNSLNPAPNIETNITVPAAIATPVATTGKKPRLRVVHLNDLFKPVPEDIVKAEVQKQQITEEINTEIPVTSTPPRSVWKSKTSRNPVIISLTDNN